MNSLHPKTSGLLAVFPIVLIALPVFFELFMTHPGTDSYLFLFVAMPSILLLFLSTLLFFLFTFQLPKTRKFRWLWLSSWLPFVGMIIVVNVFDLNFPFYLLLVNGAFPFLALPIQWYFYFSRFEKP